MSTESKVGLTDGVFLGSLDVEASNLGVSLLAIHLLVLFFFTVLIHRLNTTSPPAFIESTLYHQQQHSWAQHYTSSIHRLSTKHEFIFNNTTNKPASAISKIIYNPRLIPFTTAPTPSAPGSLMEASLILY